jgi:transcriptional regulator with XRE-family HTH domain
MPTLKQIRVDNYISRRELSELAGVAESTIVRIEEGITRTTPEVAKKVIDALGAKIGQELTLDNIEGLNLYNIMRDRRQRTKDKQTKQALDPAA